MSNKLLRPLAVIGNLTFISRILGYIRDVLIATIFGAGITTDAFFIAFKIPNFFRRIFAEGALSQAFIPVLAESRRNDEKSTADLIRAVSGALSVTVFGIVLLGILSAPLIIYVFAPGFVATPEKAALTADLLRIMFPYLGLISICALTWGIMNSYNKFAIPALCAVLFNLVLISALLLMTDYFERPIMALAVAVTLGGLVQLVFSVWGINLLGFSLRPKLDWKHPGVTKILHLMAPAALAASIVQVNLMIDLAIASFLETGSISWLYYSNRLVEFPLGVFGVALATVLLPNLSTSAAEGDVRKFSSTIDWALRWATILGLPAVAGLIILSDEMILTLFGYGAITERDVLMSSNSLSAYSMGLLAFIMIKIFGPGYYARQDMRTPVKFGLIAIGINLVFNLLLVGPLGHTGLALATAVAANANALMLWRGLRKEKIYAPTEDWLFFLIRIFIGVLGMMGFLFYVASPLSSWMDWSFGARFFRLCLFVLGSCCMYFMILRLVGVRKKHVGQFG
ncbi:MAG: murein biosynthesis integral membrane protein MurJ [Gammaproteobacteria bacterium]